MTCGCLLQELKRKLRERIQAKQERERQIKEALDKFAAHCMEKSAHAEDGRAFRANSATSPGPLRQSIHIPGSQLD